MFNSNSEIPSGESYKGGVIQSFIFILVYLTIALKKDGAAMKNSYFDISGSYFSTSMFPLPTIVFSRVPRMRCAVDLILGLRKLQAPRQYI